MAKKKPRWLLANNPEKNDICQCFNGKTPSRDWIVVARFDNQARCDKIINKCSAFFMKMPIKGRMSKGKMGKGKSKMDKGRMRKGRMGMR